MKNKKKKFSSPRATLVLLQQLQTKYFGAVEINIYVLSQIDFSAWVNGKETKIFFAGDTAENREVKYKQLLDFINSQL